jgi:hypothetical protein
MPGTSSSQSVVRHDSWSSASSNISSASSAPPRPRLPVLKKIDRATMQISNPVRQFGVIGPISHGQAQTGALPTSADPQKDDLSARSDSDLAEARDLVAREWSTTVAQMS